MQFYYLLLILSVLTINLNKVLSGKCPAKDMLFPCICNEEIDAIECGGNSFINLKSIFESIGTNRTKDDNHFNELYLNNTAIEEIPENVFGSITFRNIVIVYATSLTRIHSQAFGALNNDTRLFHAQNTPLTNHVNNYNVFDALSCLVNIEIVYFVSTNISSVSRTRVSADKAIHNKLSMVYITDNKELKSIEDYQFQDMVNLKNLYFGFNSIEYISSNAFILADNNNETLMITLENNKLNGSKSFGDGVFDKIRPPFILNLAGNTELEYLDEKIFGSVLSRSNDIYASNLEFNCDCRMAWIMKLTEQNQNHLHYATCKGGDSLFNTMARINC